MILPMNQQACFVTYKGEQHVGTVRKAGPNTLGQYRILVWSHSWGYDMECKAEDVRLPKIEFDDGSRYNARAEFMARFSVDEQVAMAKAEGNTGTTTGRISSAAPQVSNTPKTSRPFPEARMRASDPNPQHIARNRVVRRTPQPK